MCIRDRYYGFKDKSMGDVDSDCLGSVLGVNSMAFLFVFEHTVELNKNWLQICQRMTGDN